MDKRHLQQLLQEMNIPPANEDRRENAVDLALSAFEASQTKKPQKRQGSSIFSRLMKGLGKNIWRKSMNTRVMYGAGTAFTIVLITVISMVQFQVIDFETTHDQTLSTTEGNSYSTFKPAGDASPRFDFYMIENPVSVRTQRSRFVTTDTPPDQYQIQVYDQFETFEPNRVNSVSKKPVSTFSIDVDTASYSYIRRQIMRGVLPQKDAVRIEELINYFVYQYPLPEKKEHPFRTVVSVSPSPWKPANKLIHIGIKGYDIPTQEAPRANLVFLLDVSGSMSGEDRLPLLKNSMKLLLETLKPDDTVAIVVYAGTAGTVLEPTTVKNKTKILQALGNLEAGGSTAGGEGIRLAYQLAESQFNDNAVNRIILATDGDFNVGIVDHEELKGFVERKRKTGIFLSILGFGQGNLNDSLMQELAQSGNGIAAYIDTLNEARKVLVEEASSTLFPIAKDVKIQVEFNPEVVKEYRLIGYESRTLEREDFNNDAVDAGDIGSGHSVTAIYEITTANSDAQLIDKRRYQQPESKIDDSKFKGEYGFLKIRYKLPDQEISELITTPITKKDELHRIGEKDPEWAVREAGWATAVAGFGQLLKGGKYIGSFDYDAVIRLAEQSKGEDQFGYRSEFIQLVRLAKSVVVINVN